MLRHPAWSAATATSSGGAWVQGVIDRLVALAGDEEVEYVETLGGTTGPADGPGVNLVLRAFTATRRLHVVAVHRPTPEGSDAAVTVKSRAGLVRVDVLDLLEPGSEQWPPGLTLRLFYSDGDEVVVGDHGGELIDPGAPERLAAFYPSLLGDLAPGGHG
jgi:hypothetical protein